MKYLIVCSLLVLMCLPFTANAGYYSNFSSGTTITGAAMGFTTIDMRGVAYDPTEDYLVVCEDDGDQVAVIERISGATVTLINNADTGDGTVDPFRVRVSEDGMIFTQGFAGSVKLVGDATATNTDAAAAPIVVNSASYGVGTGSSRSLCVVGSYAAGTCSILSTRGATLGIFQNTPSATATFVLSATIATGFSTEPHGIWTTPDLSEIWVYQQSTGSKLFTGSVGSGYTEDTSKHAAGNWEYSIAIDRGKDLIAVTGGHGGAGGYIRTVISRYSITGFSTAVGPAMVPEQVFMITPSIVPVELVIMFCWENTISFGFAPMVVYF